MWVGGKEAEQGEAVLTTSAFRETDAQELNWSMRIKGLNG